MSQVFEEVRERASEEADAYSHGEQRPLGAYVRVMGIYSAGVVGLGAVFALTRRPLPKRPSAGDLALVALATAKTSRLVTRDAVTSPLRAPFTRFGGQGGPSEL